MDLLTILIIVLIVLVLFGGYGYRENWHTAFGPAAPSLFGILVAVILIIVILRLLRIM